MPGRIAGTLFLTAVCLSIVAASGAQSIDPVHVDQHGYEPADAKWVAVPAAAGSFEVRSVSSGYVVCSGPLVLRRASDPASGEDVHEGNFTAVTDPGEYAVFVPGLGSSPPFLVGDGVHDDLYALFLKGLYYQRCGTEIPGQYGGAWVHDSCHDGGPSIASYDWATTGGAPGGYRNTIGGWHDAGDYGKYSTNNAYAVGILLQAYESFPDRFGRDDCGIPESGNGVPDLLDEARWSLEWMLAMQDPDGAVRHRESVAAYAGMFLPEEDPETRYYTDASSDAAAMHAAAMALAGRTFASFDAAFAASCSTSAVSAWLWLVDHPDRVPPGGFVNLYGHEGATYVGTSDTRLRMWAAAEIFRLTGDTGARDYFDALVGPSSAFNGIWYPDSWGDPANLGAFTYRDAPGATPGVVSGSWWSIEDSALSSAETWASRVAVDGYGCVASTDGDYGDYYWGFTGVILRYAWALIQAYRYGGDPDHEEAAREQLHYVLGRNPMGKVYLTGVGERPVLHAHGAWNTAAGYTDIEDELCHPVPYLLVGGPNRADNADISPYPGKCYEDIADPDYWHLGNYTLNETSVNIQAAIVAVAGYFGTGGSGSGAVEDALPGAPPSGVVLLPGAPNPFREGTTIEYSLARQADVRLEIHDLAGRVVAVLTEERRGPGPHATRWDGRTDGGRRVASGVYFVRLAAGREVAVRRIVLLR
jgi:endoglucanase